MADFGKPVARRYQRLSTCDGRTLATIAPTQIPMTWIVDDGVIYRWGVPEARQKAGSHFPFDGSTAAATSLRNSLRNCHPAIEQGDWLIEEVNLPPGRFFPRMARPNYQHPGDFPVNHRREFAHERAAAMLQASALTDQLLRAFRVVDPDPRNMDAFGGEFRSILILAATEFEAQCKGVLRSNNYRDRPPSRWNTRDYVKVEPALGLADYAISFARFPWLPSISPLAGWSAANPTTSLSWYDAYNKVKHDRESQFHLASLNHALKAVCAVVVACIAQFGIAFFRDGGFGNFYQLEAYPCWSPGNTQSSLHDGPENDSPINYPFV